MAKDYKNRINTTSTNKKDNADEEKGKKKKWLLLLLLLLLLFIIIGVLLFLLLRKDEPEVQDVEGAADDMNAEWGILPGMTESEIQDRLNSAVAEGMMNIGINPNPVFPDGKSEGNLRIENIEANHYSYIVTITLDEGGDTVYKSGLLSPGYYIEKAKLSKPLRKGQYNATAHFNAYKKGNTEEVVGSAAAKIKITIAN